MLTRVPTQEAPDFPRDPPGDAAVLKPSIFDSALFIRAWHGHLLRSEQAWDLAFPTTVSDRGFAAPLILHRERHLGREIRALRPTAWGPAFSSSPCIPLDSAHLERLVQHLLGQRYGWDTLELALTLDSLDAAHGILRRLEDDGLHLVRYGHLIRPYVRFGIPWEVYYRQRSKSFRNDITRLFYRMERSGGLRVSCAAGSEAVDALESLFEFHQKRWGRRGQTSHYSRDYERNFMKALAREGTSDHGLWVYSLALGEQVIASAASLVEGRRMQYYETSFDPEFSEFSPGKVLVHCIVRDAHEKGFEEVDFGPGIDGHCGYKRWWSNGQYIECRMLFAHSRLVESWLRAALWSEPRIRSAKSGAKTLLRRLGSRDIHLEPTRVKH